jgi:hypothetical protein
VASAYTCVRVLASVALPFAFKPQPGILVFPFFFVDDEGGRRDGNCHADLSDVLCTFQISTSVWVVR